MNIYAQCPCCSDKLIHHLSHQRDYWFCRGCWQEMPVIEGKIVTQKSNQMNTHQKPKLKAFSNIKQIKQVSLSIS